MQLKKLPFILIFIASFFFALNLEADIKERPKNEKGDQPQRASRGVYDLQRNTVSNIQFYTTNYGIFGMNVDRQEGGGYWPRGSQNQYIFGVGIWFGAQKIKPDTNMMKKYVEVSYNPWNGRSWMVPGRISDGDYVNENDPNLYRIYFSTDFNPSDGVPINSEDGPNWPIWDASPNEKDTLKVNRYFGWYMGDKNQRNTTTLKKGPAFISGEDIFCTFKDTDLNKYDGGFTKRKNEGYPLRLQYEETIYSWGFGDYRDFIFLRYDIINMSPDTLWECWMAPVLDIDLSRAPQLSRGAGNDRSTYYFDEDTLNLAVQWTNPEYGERGNGFGYFGMDFLESPAIIRVRDSVTGKEIITDSTGFVRKDSVFYSNNSQLGMVTFRTWKITEDLQDDEPRYNFIASGLRDGDNGAGDMRLMMSTGPFNMRPAKKDGTVQGDTVRVIIGMIIASPAEKEEADGSTKDLAELIRKDKFAQKVYDDNFRAPTPPNRSRLYLKRALNNGINIAWDSLSIFSIDPNERGLDFMGYRLYRARRLDRDTFNVSEIERTLEYSSGRGPLGWREIARWELPTPFLKSYNRAGKNQNDPAMPFIDSLRILGPYIDRTGLKVIDTMALLVMRVCRGCILTPDWVSVGINPNRSVTPQISNIDTSAYRRPWGKYFASLPPAKLIDSTIVGVVRLNRSLVKYNPLYFRKLTIKSSKADSIRLPEDGIIYRKIDDTTFSTTVDTVYLKNTFRQAFIDNNYIYVVDILLPRPFQQQMLDSLHVRMCLDSVYSYIKRGVATTDFPNFEDSLSVKDKVIYPYMNEITRNSEYFDIGDDNKSANIYEDPNPSKTEKLINNVDYYYKLLAYDEGDYNQPTPSKLNDAFEGLPNLAKTSPRASTVGNKADFKITYVDSAKIGGLYNFNFFTINTDRAMQDFAGHELELEFQPMWELSRLVLFGRTATDAIDFGLYTFHLLLRDLTTKNLLFDGFTRLEVTPCNYGYRGLFTENAASWVLSDSVIVDTFAIPPKYITFGTRNSRETAIRSGKFSTGDFTQEGFCYSFEMIPPGYGTIGFEFDFTMKQLGGNFRPDTVFKKLPKSGRANNIITPLTSIDVTGLHNTDIIMTTQPINYIVARLEYNSYYPIPVYASFNNGPGNYLVQFLPGGIDTLDLIFGTQGKRNKFIVDYLNLKVTNTMTLERPTPDGGSVVLSYPNEIAHMYLDTAPAFGVVDAHYYPDPRSLQFHNINTNDFIGKYNIAPFGYVNARNKPSPLKWKNQFARPAVGVLSTKDITYLDRQGKYYLSALSMVPNSEGLYDTLDFVHVMNISGVQFVFDYVNQGSRDGKARQWDYQPDSVYAWGKDFTNHSDDFQPGDSAMFSVFGGSFGLPMPGAKVRAMLSKAIPDNNQFTDEILNDVKVVPNPYYISHQGQKSPYDSKIYFTKLPPRCTIEIFTIMGELVRKIEHDEYSSIDKYTESVEAWNLLSKNNQRVQSQSLVAVIKTPNGAMAVKNFTVIVGGYRLIQD